jgi:anti-anti-sigma factor
MKKKNVPHIAQKEGAQASPPVFALPSSMAIENAEPLAHDLRQLCASASTKLTLDASAVDSISTPGLQLLVSLSKAMQSRGGDIAIIGARDIFSRAVEDSGLSAALGRAN